MTQILWACAREKVNTRTFDVENLTKICLFVFLYICREVVQNNRPPNWLEKLFIMEIFNLWQDFHRRMFKGKEIHQMLWREIHSLVVLLLTSQFWNKDSFQVHFCEREKKSNLHSSIHGWECCLELCDSNQTSSGFIRKSCEK